MAHALFVMDRVQRSLFDDSPAAMNAIVAAHEMRGHAAAFGHRDAHGFLGVFGTNNHFLTFGLCHGALLSLDVLGHFDEVRQPAHGIGLGFILVIPIAQYAQLRQVPDGPDVVGRKHAREGEGPCWVHFQLCADTGCSTFKGLKTGSDPLSEELLPASPRERYGIGI